MHDADVIDREAERFGDLLNAARRKKPSPEYRRIH